ISRDDSAKFLNYYLNHGLWPDDPFETLDQKGVGLLMKWAVEKGRSTKPNLKVGICGVHGGDPRSIVFCHQIGLNYVSCSAYQIPIARLTAAQIAIQEKMAEQKGQTKAGSFSKSPAEKSKKVQKKGRAKVRK
ncbi:MAG: putative PEP-binding protein, partial [Candidatus Saccharicenans sp.]